MATTTDLLADAEAKLHALMTGRAIVKLRDQNGEEITYSQANRNALKAYVDDLKKQVAGTPAVTGPMSFYL